MEFDQSPENSLCPHTMGSEQGKKAAHQENYHLWEGREKCIPELTKTSGQLPHSQLPFLSLIVRLNSWHSRIHLVKRGLVSASIVNTLALHDP